MYPRKGAAKPFTKPQLIGECIADGFALAIWVVIALLVFVLSLREHQDLGGAVLFLACMWMIGRQANQIRAKVRRYREQTAAPFAQPFDPQYARLLSAAPASGTSGNARDTNAQPEVEQNERGRRRDEIG